MAKNNKGNTALAVVPAELVQSLVEPFEERVVRFQEHLDSGLSGPVADLLAQVTPNLKISSNQEYADARALHRTLKGFLRNPDPAQLSIEGRLGTYARMADRLHKAITGVKAKYTQAIQAGIDTVSRAITGYEQEQERLRREAEEKARREAEVEQRRQQVRLMLPMFADAGVSEQQVRDLLAGGWEQPSVSDISTLTDLLRTRQREIAEAKAKQEREEAAAQARALGHEDLAQEIAASEVEVAIPEPLPPPPPVVTAPVVATTMPKIAGASTRKNYRFRVVNPNLIPREYLMPADPYDADSYPKIGQTVRAQKLSTNIPGIEVYVDETAVSRL